MMAVATDKRLTQASGGDVSGEETRVLLSAECVVDGHAFHLTHRAVESHHRQARTKFTHDVVQEFDLDSKSLQQRDRTKSGLPACSFV